MEAVFGLHRGHHLQPQAVPLGLRTQSWFPRDLVNLGSGHTHQNNEVSIIQNTMSEAKCYGKYSKPRDVVSLKRERFWSTLSEQNSGFLWLPRLGNTIPIPQAYWPDRLSRLVRPSCFKVEAHADFVSARFVPSDLAAKVSEIGKVRAAASAKPARKRRRKTMKPGEPQQYKCRKVRIFPNAEQKKKIEHVFNVVRWTYNRCVEAINKGLMSVDAARQEFVREEGLKRNSFTMGPGCALGDPRRCMAGLFTSLRQPYRALS